MSLLQVFGTDNSRSGKEKRPPRPGGAGALCQRIVRQALRATLLSTIFVFSYYLSYWLRFEGQLGSAEFARFSSTVAYVVLIKLAIFRWFRIWPGWVRFLTFYDLIALVQASTTSLLVTVLVERLFLPGQAIPRSVYLMDWGTTIALVGGARAVLRILRERDWLFFLSADKVPAFIVGANEAGESLLRAITSHENLSYRVVGFLDDDPKRKGERIGGVPVIGTIDQTCQLAERYRVRQVLIVADGLPGRRVRKLVEQARRNSVRVHVLPSYQQLIDGNVAVQLRSVSIDDLLRRDPVKLEMGNIRQWIDDRVLLVTGSAGSIGSEICRQLLRFSPKKIVLVDRSETAQFFLERELRGLASQTELEVCLADVLDQRRLREILRAHRPEIIFHAAAYKHVPLMEACPGEAIKNIVVATRRLADLAIENEVQSFVMISTDKAVHPTSVMGACKRAAELYVQSLASGSPCRFVTVRFGNVLDSAGSVVQVFRQQIARGGPVTVTDERMERFFMTIPEAARLVIQAGVIGNAGEILLLDMGVPVRIVDLAADMIRLSGLEVGKDIDIDFTGLRPGEKLFEELHAAGEKHRPTRHSKIMVVDGEQRDPQAVLAAIERLESLADAEQDRILEELEKMVPEYQIPGRRKEPRKRAAA
jgi:FlaA1/EpsC-like NDP-sugar epimerase